MSQVQRDALKVQSTTDKVARARLTKLLQTHQVFHRFSFLYDGYRHDLYWWEVLVVLRKISVAIIAATVTDGHTQMFAASCVVTVSLALQLSVQPYIIPGLNALEVLSLLSTLILMLGCLLFWQVGDVAASATALTAFLFLVLVSTLVIFVYAMIGGVAKKRVRKAVGERRFKACSNCIKQACKNKRSPAEIRAELLADEAAYDEAVAAAAGAQPRGGDGDGDDVPGGGMLNPLLAATRPSTAPVRKERPAPESKEAADAEAKDLAVFANPLARAGGGGGGGGGPAGAAARRARTPTADAETSAKASVTGAGAPVSEAAPAGASPVAVRRPEPDRSGSWRSSGSSPTPQRQLTGDVTTEGAPYADDGV
jgi:hypothetical protein